MEKKLERKKELECKLCKRDIADKEIEIWNKNMRLCSDCSNVIDSMINCLSRIITSRPKKLKDLLPSLKYLVDFLERRKV